MKKTFYYYTDKFGKKLFTCNKQIAENRAAFYGTSVTPVQLTVKKGKNG